MAKILDLDKTIYELCKEDPGVAGIMAAVGFERITDPVMIGTVGRVMTLPKGAAMRGIDLEKVKAEFVARGYEIKETSK
jgi:hypothetical protein